MTFEAFLAENLSEAWLHGALSWDCLLAHLALVWL